MRNGNMSGNLDLWNSVVGSYRTYEEWKRYAGIWDTWDSSGFLPYLWGMETWNESNKTRRANQSSYRTYEEWKLLPSGLIVVLSKVLTVPMRNGNWIYLFLHLLQSSVLTVPMRNGNVFISVCTLSNLGSYRTYEEWKPVCYEWCNNNYLGSYRTYEEWKPFLLEVLSKLK